jgi:hypothetical protein
MYKQRDMAVSRFCSVAGEQAKAESVALPSMDAGMEERNFTLLATIDSDEQTRSWGSGTGAINWSHGRGNRASQ